MDIIAFFRAFKAGQSLENPETWKQAQLLTSAFTGILVGGVGVAKLFGVEVNLDETQAQQIAGGLVALLGVFGVCNYVVTVVSTKKIDMLGRTSGETPSGGGTGGSTGRTPEPVGRPEARDILDVLRGNN